MTKDASRLDEAVSVCLGIREQVGLMAKALEANTAAVRGLGAVLEQMQRRDSTRDEILQRILEAATREGGGEVADAIRALGTVVAEMAENVRFLRERAEQPAQV